LRTRNQNQVWLAVNGRLIVEQTATYPHGSALATHVGGRVIPGDEPQVVWVNRYERGKR
jgi:hypothetical protein